MENVGLDLGLTQTWIDRLFYREKYNAGLMLQRLSEMTASLLALDKITHMILSEVVNSLQIENAAMFVKEDKNGDYRVLEQLGYKQEKSNNFRYSCMTLKNLKKKH